jgi:hypothetical protein
MQSLHIISCRICRQEHLDLGLAVGFQLSIGPEAAFESFKRGLVVCASNYAKLGDIANMGACYTVLLHRLVVISV